MSTLVPTEPATPCEFALGELAVDQLLVVIVAIAVVALDEGADPRRDLIAEPGAGAILPAVALALLAVADVVVEQALHAAADDREHAVEVVPVLGIDQPSVIAGEVAAIAAVTAGDRGVALFVRAIALLVQPVEADPAADDVVAGDVEAPVGGGESVEIVVLAVLGPGGTRGAGREVERMPRPVRVHVDLRRQDRAEVGLLVVVGGEGVAVVGAAQADRGEDEEAAGADAQRVVVLTRPVLHRDVGIGVVALRLLGQGLRRDAEGTGQHEAGCGEMGPVVHATSETQFRARCRPGGSATTASASLPVRG